MIEPEISPPKSVQKEIFSDHNLPYFGIKASIMALFKKMCKNAWFFERNSKN